MLIPLWQYTVWLNTMAHRPAQALQAPATELAAAPQAMVSAGLEGLSTQLAIEAAGGIWAKTVGILSESGSPGEVHVVGKGGSTHCVEIGCGVGRSLGSVVDVLDSKIVLDTDVVRTGNCSAAVVEELVIVVNVEGPGTSVGCWWVTVDMVSDAVIVDTTTVGAELSRVDNAFEAVLIAEIPDSGFPVGDNVS